MSIESKLREYAEQNKIPEKILLIYKGFCETYLGAIKNHEELRAEGERMLSEYLDVVYEQINNPYTFGPYHQRVSTPFDYYQLSLDLFRPLINFSQSKVLGLEHVERMTTQLKAKENVILLANHQIEPDPQIISLLLQKDNADFAKNLIFIAGNRVTTDPLAVPFSMGCNLICIYSKKHMDFAPDLKEQKQLHNQKAMQILKSLLSEGGKCIFVAPSGGRDRINSNGKVEVAPFDAQSIELFWLIAQQAEKPTHFYPMSLATYWLLPPPHSVDIEIGETRSASRSPAHIVFGAELDMDIFPGCVTKDRKLRRQMRAEYIWKIVNDNYLKIEGS